MSTRSSSERFVWYDTETTGRDPASDRIIQLAYVETDEELRAFWEEEWQILLGTDVLPNLDAMLVNGSQLVARRLYPDFDVHHRERPRTARPSPISLPSDQDLGIIRRTDGPDFRRCSLSDHELAEALAWLFFGRPHTVQAGFNSIAFDDNFVRHTLYRNLYDPYRPDPFERGGRRLDALNMIRAVSVAAPDALRWPNNNDGNLSYRLEDLAAENDVEFSGKAHDALSDVRVTLELARLVRQNAPGVWKLANQGSERNSVERRLKADLNGDQAGILLHVSGVYGNARRCTAPVATVCSHPQYRRRYVVIDLARDPGELLGQNPDDLRERLYKRNEALEESGETRPPLGVIVATQAPLLLLDDNRSSPIREWAGYDIATVQRYRETARKHARELQDICKKVFGEESYRPPQMDPELSLYGDGFPSDSERAAINAVRTKILDGEKPSSAAITGLPKKYQTLAGRLMARAQPGLLSESQRKRWRARVQEWREQGFGGRPSVAQLRSDISRCQAGNSEEQEILDNIAKHIAAWDG